MGRAITSPVVVAIPVCASAAAFVVPALAVCGAHAPKVEIMAPAGTFSRVAVASSSAALIVHVQGALVLDRGGSPGKLRRRVRVVVRQVAFFLLV